MANKAVRQFGSILLKACAVAASLALCAPAAAVQHLIPPGQDWESLVSRIRPGDEIILMPGKHRPASFVQLAGEHGKPIVIRSADPTNPVEIQADLEGLRIDAAAYLVIKDLIITGASVNGLSLTGFEDQRTKAGLSPVPIGDVTIRNVVVNNTGPRGQRHGIMIAGMSDVRIENCRINGWGGSGIEIVGCREVSIEQCELTGQEDHSQVHGIRVRGGSQSVRIERCRLTNAGLCPVSMGASKRVTDQGERSTVPLLDTPAEASFCLLQDSLIIGGQYAIALVHADDCVMRRNTIVRPRGCVLALIAEATAQPASVSSRNIFGGNLIVWEPGDIERLVKVSPLADAKSFVLESNLWWSPENANRLEKIGPLPGERQWEQIFDIDPKLDDQYRPTAPEAMQFGRS